MHFEIGKGVVKTAIKLFSSNSIIADIILLIDNRHTGAPTLSTTRFYNYNSPFTRFGDQFSLKAWSMLAVHRIVSLTSVQL